MKNCLYSRVTGHDGPLNDFPHTWFTSVFISVLNHYENVCKVSMNVSNILGCSWFVSLKEGNRKYIWIEKIYWPSYILFKVLSWIFCYDLGSSRQSFISVPGTSTEMLLGAGSIGTDVGSELLDLQR